MDINYIILAYKNPKQLRRQIERLNSSDCYFYIHVDRKVDIQPFYNEIRPANNIYFLPLEKRQDCIWGSIGIIVATILILQQILLDKRFGYCVLQSGQDYPLKENYYIKSFFANNYGNEFVNNFAFPVAFWPKGGLDRLTNYRIDFSNKKGDFLLFPAMFDPAFYSLKNAKNVLRLISSRKIAVTKLLYRRSFPKYLKPYGGSSWWAITTETARKVVDFINIHPDYLDYHKYTTVPDEVFFQSIILDIKDLDFDKIRETVTYVNWERKDAPLPVCFTFADFQEIVNLSSDLLFARKFDTDVDSQILDEIDKTLLNIN